MVADPTNPAHAGLINKVLPDMKARREAFTRASNDQLFFLQHMKGSRVGEISESDYIRMIAILGGGEPLLQGADSVLRSLFGADDDDGNYKTRLWVTPEDAYWGLYARGDLWNEYYQAAGGLVAAGSPLADVKKILQRLAKEWIHHFPVLLEGKADQYHETGRWLFKSKQPGAHVMLQRDCWEMCANMDIASFLREKLGEGGAKGALGAFSGARPAPSLTSRTVRAMGQIGAAREAASGFSLMV